MSSVPDNESDSSTSAELKLLIAVDFGTTFSGVAFANTLEQYSQDIVTDWGEGNQGEKVPTILRYDNRGTNGLFKWGFQLSKDVRPGEKVHEWFKLGLSPELQEQHRRSAESELLRKYPSTTALPPVEGEECKKLVKDYLSSLREATDSLLRRTFDVDIYTLPREYIITVPAMWSRKAQSITHDCAVRAGMGDRSSLQMIAEPEAAGIYALATMQQLGLREGDTFVICDAGGGTVDLSSYKIKSLDHGVDIHCATNPSGGLCGSSFLNRIFADFVRNRLRGHVDLDSPRFQKWIKVAVDQDFESRIKPRFAGDDDDKKDYILASGFPPSAQHGITEDEEFVISGRDLRERVFDPVISKILDLVQGQIANSGHVKAVLLAGGFGKNAYLQKRLKDCIKGVDVRPIKDSSTAIVRGALIAGFNGLKNPEQLRKELRQPRDNTGMIHSGRHTLVSSRVAPCSFGVPAFEPYDPYNADHVQHRDARIRDDNGIEKIEVMKWFVTKVDMRPRCKKDEVLHFDHPKSFALYYTNKIRPGSMVPDDIRCKIYAYGNGERPLFPHSPQHPNPAIEKPLVTLTIHSGDIPAPEHIKRNTYQGFNFDVYMTIESAKMKFVLGSGDQRFEPEYVFM